MFLRLPRPLSLDPSGKHKLVDMFDKAQVLAADMQPELLAKFPTYTQAVDEARADLAKEPRAGAIQMLCTRGDRSLVLISVRRDAVNLCWNFGIHPHFR